MESWYNYGGLYRNYHDLKSHSAKIKDRKLEKIVDSLGEWIDNSKKSFCKKQKEKKMDLNFSSDFTVKELDKRLSSLGSVYEKDGGEFLFNLSKTRWFSVNALLALLTTIDYIEMRGGGVKIVLPEGDNSESKKGAKQARDFLKRWNFFEELKYYLGDEKKYFKYEQLDYLTEEQEFYLRSKILDEQGVMSEEYRYNVIEISHFTEKKAGKQQVSPCVIEKYLSGYSTEERIFDALSKGIDWKGVNVKDMAKEFVTKCIREPMENAMSHAEATMALVGAQTYPEYFSISISDNGVSIPTTIEPVFRALRGDKQLSDQKLIEYAFLLPTKGELNKILSKLEKVDDATLIQLATEKGVTSKPPVHKGLGLFLLKDFIRKSQGYFTVRSGRGSVMFDYREGKEQCNSRSSILYRGTLITSFLPLKQIKYEKS